MRLPCPPPTQLPAYLPARLPACLPACLQEVKEAIVRRLAELDAMEVDRRAASEVARTANAMLEQLRQLAASLQPAAAQVSASIWSVGAAPGYLLSSCPLPSDVLHSGFKRADCKSLLVELY